MNILYEDNHIIAVFKPANVLTQGDISGDRSLFDMVKHYIKTKYNKPGNVYLGLVHRLDRPTQGVVVFAKTSKAAARLSEQFRTGSMKKEYHARVHGQVNPGKGTLTHYLVKNHTTNNVQAYDTNKKDAKLAVLEYEVLSYNREQDTSSIVVILKTGRSHQIRVQFAKIGHPIVGDKKYCSTSDDSDQMALVAHAITFEHPISKEYITITCENQ